MDPVYAEISSSCQDSHTFETGLHSKEPVLNVAQHYVTKPRNTGFDLKLNNKLNTTQ